MTREEAERFIVENQIVEADGNGYTEPSGLTDKQLSKKTGLSVTYVNNLLVSLGYRPKDYYKRTDNHFGNFETRGNVYHKPSSIKRVPNPRPIKDKPKDK